MNDKAFTDSQALDDFVISSLDADKRRAHLLAIVAMIYAAIVTVALIFLFPLKTLVPLPVVVDRGTGQTTVIGQTDELQDATVIDVMDRHNISKYLIAREGYNPASLHSDFDFVKSATANALWPEYAANFDESRPDNYLSIYRGKNVLVNVKTISLLSDPSTRRKASSERSYRVEIDRVITTSSSQSERINYNVVLTTTMRQIAQEESQVRINPLGFYVSTYTRNQMITEAR